MLSKKQKEVVKEKNLKLFYNRRDFLDKERIRLASFFDRYLLIFATGALYLSILFTNNLAEDVSRKILLGAGWTSLIISIFLTLISVIFSEYAFKKQIQITDMEIEDILDEASRNRRDNCWNIVVTFTRWVGILFFIAGVILLSLFYYINI